MNRRLLAAGSVLLLGVLLGRYWPAPVRDEATHAPSAAPASESATRHPAAPAPYAAPTPDIAKPSPAALAVDAAILWPQARRLLHCARWNRNARLGGGHLDPESIDTDLDEWIDGLIDGAVAQWRAQTRNEQRAALLQHWSKQITSLCAPLGEPDEDTLYRSARDAALLGPREARMAFITEPPPAQLARRLDLWGDWVDTSVQLLDDMAAHGDAEALLLRGIVLGFDKPPRIESGIGGTLDSLAPAIDNDPVRAYRDLHAYLASGDTRWAATAQALLQKLGKRLDAAQRAVIDAEFAKR